MAGISHHRRRMRRERAFTLVEMLVVLGIIALVTAISIPMLIPFMRGRKVELAAEMVKMSCVLARSRAVELKHRVCVVLLEAEKTIVVVDYEQLKKILPVLERGTVTLDSTESQLVRSSSGGSHTSYYVTLLTGPCFGAQRVIVKDDATIMIVADETHLYPLEADPAEKDEEYVIGGHDYKYVAPQYLAVNYQGADDEARAEQRHELLELIALVPAKVLPEGCRFDLDDEPADGTDPERHGWAYIFHPTGSVWTLDTQAENRRNEHWSRTTYTRNDAPAGPRIYGPMDEDSQVIIVYAMTGQAISE